MWFKNLDPLLWAQPQSVEPWSYSAKATPCCCTEQCYWLFRINLYWMCCVSKLHKFWQCIFFPFLPSCAPRQVNTDRQVEIPYFIVRWDYFSGSIKVIESLLPQKLNLYCHKNWIFIATKSSPSANKKQTFWESISVAPIPFFGPRSDIDTWPCSIGRCRYHTDTDTIYMKSCILLGCKVIAIMAL